MRSLIIHMSNSQARRPNAERLRDLLPGAELIEAVNGRDPDQIEDVRIHAGKLHTPAYPFPLGPAEIGVFQSHRRCWQRIVDEGWDYALITEDDLAISPAPFARALNLVQQHMTPQMYVRLPAKNRERPTQILASDGEVQLTLPRVIGLQCICQVVGRAAAQRLLDGSVELDRPVDTWLQMHWATGQPVHAILPNGNSEIANQIGGSTIQVKTPARGKLLREIRRAMYRTRLNLRPQKA